MAAAVEQHHDDNGILWPGAIAPYDVHVVALSGGEETLLETAEQVAAELDTAGFTVLLDDRDARPGEKFADADLVGAPIRITVGRKSLEDGMADVRRRGDGDERRVSVSDIVKGVIQSNAKETQVQ